MRDRHVDASIHHSQHHAMLDHAAKFAIKKRKTVFALFAALLVTATTLSLYLVFKANHASGTQGTVAVVPAASTSPPINGAEPPLQPARREKLPEGQSEDDIYKQSLQDVAQDIAPLVAHSPHLKDLHGRLMVEGRDKAWAPRSEKAIGEQYMKMIGSDFPGATFTINCGTTICEARLDLEGVEEARRGGLSGQIQSLEIMAYLMDHGYYPTGGGFGPGARDRELNLFYYRRQAPRKIETRSPPE